MKFVQVTLMTVVAMTAISATAATEANYCGTDSIPVEKKDCKNIPSNRRQELGKSVGGGNPVAVTNKDGDLKVWYTVGGSKLQDCQITNNVKSFKMSQNPGDLSTVYFIRNGDLMDAKMHGQVGSGTCPTAMKQNYSADNRISGSDDIVEYKLASNPNSKVTVAARTRSNVVIYATDKKLGEKQYFRTEQQANDEMDRLLGN